MDYNKAEINIGNHAFAQRYVVKSRALFLKTINLFHSIFDSGSEDWEMNVIPKDLMAYSNALKIGIIQNSFASTADYLLQSTSDTKEDVILELIFEGTLGKHAQPFVQKFRKDFVAQ